MILDKIIEQYITYRKSLGEKFTSNETCLKSFSKAMGLSIDVQSVSEENINNFLYGSSKAISSGWFIKHSTLLGFYKYALTRHYVSEVPLPSVMPKRPQPFIPYIYSNKELKLIFDTAFTYQINKSDTQPLMVYVVLVLTYALGLRIHETLAITLGNIDMNNLVIKIQESKFYKSRLVPFNIQIKEVIQEYLQLRIKRNQPQLTSSLLFMGKNNKAFNIATMRAIFQKIREKTEIKRHDSNFQPRIHDLRHTFAVNRLASWYQENKDVHQLLPILSVYLGHKYLSHTTVYLTMTDSLLQEASARFEKYAIGEQK